MILTEYAIKFRTAVFVFMAVIVVAGIYSYATLPREGSPDITIPYVFITAFYEGTAPEEMEKLVTIPIEKKINDVDGIKTLSSVSAENVTSISIEFQAGRDIDQALQLVKNKVDLARPDLPNDLDEPTVQAFNFSSDSPVFTVTLSGATDLERLKNLAEDLQDQIELLPGVKQADVVGARVREIRLELDLTRMIAYNIPLGLVLQRVAQENSTISAGNIELAGDKFQVRIPGEFTLVPEIKDLVLTERAGQPVYLADIATVIDTFKDRDSISRLNGEPCVALEVKKRSGENTVSMVRNIQKIMDQFACPADVRLTVVYNEADYVIGIIKDLENNIISGFLLVVLVILVFMGLRNSLLVGIAIPFSLLIGFLVMDVMDYALNMVVLFALVLAVGMLVDNAIVIVECIYRHRTNGLSRSEAARVGAAEVAWPVITSTLTTVAAFYPLLFWPDIMGQFMSFMPKTLIVVLLASLFVAIVINPAVCAVLIKPATRPLDPLRPHWFVRRYETILRGALHHRISILLLGFALLFLSVELYGRYGSGMELFPATEPRNAVVVVAFPQGVSIERTDAALRRIEQKLARFEDIKFIHTAVGSGEDGGVSRAQGTHVGRIHIEFKELSERRGKSSELVDQIRAEVGVIPGAETKVAKSQEGPPGQAPVSIELSGDEFEDLSELAAEIERRIETVPGLVDLQDDFEEALPEIQFLVDRPRAALLGLDTDTIGVFLRAAIYGLESSKFRADEDEYDITVRLPLDQRNTMSLMDQVFIPTAQGRNIPLSSLGKAQYTGGRGAIRRKNQKRIITITGNNQGRGVDKIIVDVRKRLADLQLPRGYKLAYAGDTEEMQKSGEFLKKAFLIAVGLIAVILVIEFNSVLLPAIIMFTVILSLVGVVWGLLICRMKFGVIMTGLGVISLAGVVVNNGIVLIDFIVQRRRAGLDPFEAVVDAGKTRLRPVLLTAVTTVLGLIPMAIGYSVDFHYWPPRLVASAESSSWWAPMAVAVIFGLSLATLLTLVLVPIMFSLAESVAHAFRRWFGMHDE